MNAFQVLSPNTPKIYQARARQIGLDDLTIAALVTGNIGTMGSFAFCCNCQPNAPDETPLINALTTVLGGQAPSIGQMSKFRRLFFEAHTVALVDMRTRCEGTTDGQPRRMQLPERVQRMVELRARYPGFSIVGEMEFSYALLDKVVDQFDRNELRFIPLEECTRRDQELDGVKRDDILKIEVKKDDSLRLEREQANPTARLATDLEIRNAFFRRALAYDAAGLLSFPVHEAWINKLFRIMQEATVEGHSAVSLQQAYRADRKLWQKMASETVGNIQPLVGAIKPLDAALLKYGDHVEVSFLLLPLPTFQSSSSSNHAPVMPVIVPSQSSGKGSAAPSIPRNAPYSKGKGGKGNNGKKGAKADRSPKLSPSGCAYTLSSGKPCCIYFNGAPGCNTRGVAIGKRCSRGFHNCGKLLANKTVCSGDHPMFQCTAI